ncbi:Cof-type HAD-IIB family hydrolase [Macrococcus brunensis]|uniref:Cof-type HAD-IIB family hydrolase n=1 Tax=Macrococcus brunensis TaxID=198483 RepID=UPI001EF0474F|nr:Cof-type HAD-IIB family hydrolase [Macrococcus brunensis]ULG71791.1 Cof-type HAD-IIB family hydrolase [Macrococcus brunensis]ULG74049.1 Cof-type HAD-IIB family hydrolase [Macrococcus brunensis]
MIRLIATDMDGTLLNSGHEISQENIEAIRYAQSQGVTVVIATGRAFYEANMPVKPTGLTVPYICLNGAEIRDEQFNITHTSHLNPEQIEEVTGVLRKYDIFYQVYTNFGIYTEDKEKDLQIYLDIAMQAGNEPDEEKIREGIEKRLEQGTLKEVDDYSMIYDREGELVMKLLAYTSDHHKLMQAKSELKAFSSLAVSASARNNLEITHADAQKGVALKRIAEQLEIPLSETMALGDNLNDVSMLEVAGFSVAMENAARETKAIAKYLTDSNEESGVGRAIMKYVKQENE